mmetsp:Transcript_49017/g.111649  ORF Transcript_49017/g.111649 Transcript_49017/m.111649 type:complete len:246 (+) Transcript_49017:76-813(+)
MSTPEAGVVRVEAWETGGFTQQAMDSVAGMRVKIKAMPFLSELVAGTLSPETFAHYLMQDHLYLREYGKVLKGLADKAITPEAKENMSRAAENITTVEGALHETFLTELSVLSAEEREKVEASPTCQGYTDFQQTLLASAPYEVAFASIMPCYTIYCEVGRWIESNAPSVEALDAHPYARWIRTYGGDGFEQATARAAGIFDNLAAAASDETRAQMLRTFQQAARFEYMFWDSAYTNQAWPVAIN